MVRGLRQRKAFSAEVSNTPVQEYLRKHSELGDGISIEGYGTVSDDLPPAVCVSMGNPHAVLFYDDVSQVDIADLGSSLEVHPLFPERANIEFVSVISENHLRMRVWERGAGITDACGSGACATAVAAIKKGLTGAEMRITLDGGDLFLRWSQEGQHAGRVIMTGPVSYVADGRLHSELSDMLLR